MATPFEKPWFERAASALVIGGTCVLMAAITLFMGLTNG